MSSTVPRRRNGPSSLTVRRVSLTIRSRVQSETVRVMQNDSWI